jgi:hypothetical protein
MPGLVLHSQAGLTCSHGGQLQITPAQTRALVGGLPIATVTATMAVGACPGVSGAICSTAKWANVSTRVMADHQFVLLQAPVPLVPPAVGNAAIVGPPPNTPLVLAMQPRVVAAT